jgi:hypothetical protein
MFKLYKEMYEQYGTDPNHVLYTSRSIHDVNYFTVHKVGSDIILKQRVNTKVDGFNIEHHEIGTTKAKN